MNPLTDAGDGESPPADAQPVAVAAPFNLLATARLLQRRPTNRVDVWDDGRYARLIDTDDGPRLLSVANLGAIDAPALRLEIAGGPTSAATARQAATAARWILGLDAPPAPTAELADLEPRFGSVAAALRGFRPPCFPTLFETCARVIPFQQVSLDAGTAIVGRLVERFGASRTIGGRDWFAFPPPAAIAEAPLPALRDVGLSRAKAMSLQAVAREALTGALDAARVQALPTERALAELQALPGIGPWSAGVILLRGLRRMDVFPTGDVGAARNLPRLLGLDVAWSPDEASAFAAGFGDRRGYLYFFGLGGQLLARGLLAPADPD
ncbi:MAG TPA: hypothetical protein VFI22_06645 [Thermomicrobiales bacterium]|nr:hypothetical protein [Thermomicrobiales bacterium]